MSTTRELLHVRLTTGHISRSPRAEVCPDLLSWLHRRLATALEQGEPADLGDGYRLRTWAAGHLLTAEVLSPAPDKCVTLDRLAVARCEPAGVIAWREMRRRAPARSRLPESLAVPWCCGEPTPAAAWLPPDARASLGDVELYAAWCWIALLRVGGNRR